MSLRVWRKSVQATHTRCFYSFWALMKFLLQLRAEQLPHQAWLLAGSVSPSAEPGAWAAPGMLWIPYLCNPTLQSCLTAHTAQGVKGASVPGPGHNLGIVGGQLERGAPAFPSCRWESFSFQVPSFVTVDVIPSRSPGCATHGPGR